MKVVKLETYFYVPDDVSTGDVAHYVTHEAQTMFGVAERMTETLQASEPIKWSGVTYTPDELPRRFKNGALIGRIGL